MYKLFLCAESFRKDFFGGGLAINKGFMVIIERIMKLGTDSALS